MILTDREKVALHTLGKDFGQYRLYDICKEFGKKNSFINYVFKLQEKEEKNE